MNLNHIPQIKHTNSGNFFVLAGPCAIEGEEMALRIAEKLQIIYKFHLFSKEVSKKQIVQELIVFLELEMKKHLKYLKKFQKNLEFQL
jgi:2-dehydro-3-deoxyphosphooctonate aldolase (KDO 8-P synthase)